MSFALKPEHMFRLLQKFCEATPMRCGLRPYSADGIILLGRVENTANLSLNVGPGFNGWKICLGAAATLNKEDTSLFSFDCSKLAPSNRVKSSPLLSILNTVTSSELLKDKYSLGSKY